MSEPSAIPVLSETLGWSIFPTMSAGLRFVKISNRGEHILNDEDLDPPRAPGTNAPPNAYRVYDKAERAYNRYQESRLLVCVTLFQSFYKELQSRVI